MYTLYGKMYTLSRPRKAKKCLRACAKCADSHHPAHTKSHPGICSPLKHSIMSSDSADSEGPDQTAHARSLIWAVAVCICLKTCFCMARPIQTKISKYTYFSTEQDFSGRQRFDCVGGWVGGLTTRQPLWVILCRLPEREKRDRRDSRRDEREEQ